MIFEYERFVAPEMGDQYYSEYDIPSDELLDLIQRQPAGVSVKLINTHVAGRLTINEPGFGFAVYGLDSISLAKYQDAFTGVAINSDGNDVSKIFPGKSGRGFRGAFTSLTLIWPADPLVTAALFFIIFKSRRHPWTGGLEAT